MRIYKKERGIRMIILNNKWGGVLPRRKEARH